jgi:medium-chain acyl-[acyl-carrier-protein] hydrolase
MTKLKPIISEEQLITSADTDFSRQMSLSALVNFHIQVAWHHAEHLGFGMQFLHDHGLVWMLSRLHIRLFSIPFWNDTIRLESWPKGINRLFYLRDFQFSDKEGSLISKATSEWLIINWETKRPKLHNPDHNIFHENLDRHALDGAVPVLQTPESEYEEFWNQVSYSDIDLNQHLTTTRYVEWMLNGFELEYLRQYAPAELVINFSREIPYGTKVTVRRYRLPEENCWQFEYLLPENETVSFRGYIGFSPREQV